MKTLIEQARQIGRTAASKGITIPARDADLMALMQANRQQGLYAANPLLTAWYEGRDHKEPRSLPATLRAAALMGCIVTIPAHLPAPSTYCEQFRRDGEARIGRVVEAGGNIVAVQFFGYPHTWDYTLREAAEFEVNSTMLHVPQGWTPGAAVMRVLCLEDKDEEGATV